MASRAFSEKGLVARNCATFVAKQLAFFLPSTRPQCVYQFMILYGFLLLFIWMVLARGLPDSINELRDKKFGPLPPWWALLAAAGLIWALDSFYRTETPEAKSQKALRALVERVNKRDYKGAINLLEDVALSPPWVPRDTDELIPRGF